MRIWRWTGLLGSFSCDRPLALIPCALKGNSVCSHFTLEGKWDGRSGGLGGGEMRTRREEEEENIGEKILFHGEDEEWSGVERGRAKRGHKQKKGRKVWGE